MKIFARYLAREVLHTSLLVFSFFVCINFFIAFLGELNDVGNGNYHLPQALSFVILHFPTQFYRLFPVVALLGVLMGLGNLSEQRELVALQAAGVSLKEITLFALKRLFILVCVVTFLVEWVGPKLEFIAQSHKTIALSGQPVLQTETGVWLRDGDCFIHIDEVSDNHTLSGVTSYEFYQQQLLWVRHAALAVYQHKNWQLQDVVETHIFADHTEVSHETTRLWPVSLKPQLLKMGDNAPNQMSLLELYNFSNYRTFNHLPDLNYWLNFWQRIFAPFYALEMMLIAVPFVFGALRSTTSGLRLFVGLVVGLLFYLGNQFIVPISNVYQLSPIVAALLPMLIFAVLGWTLLQLSRKLQ